MTQSHKRPIPLAAAALSLTFGSACGAKSHPPAGGGGGDGSILPPGASSGTTGSANGGTNGPGRPVPPPDGSGEALATVADQFVEDYCESFERCFGEQFESYFPAGQAECVRYYDDYFGGYYASLVERARNPAACESATIEVLDCYTETYVGLSCDELYYAGYCYTDYYYYDYYYGGYYYDDYGGYYTTCLSCWDLVGAEDACR